MVSLLGPCPYTDAGELRRSRLLSLSLLGLGGAALAAGMGAAISLLQPGAIVDPLPAAFPLLVFAAVLAASWFLNRAGHLQLAAWLFVAALTLLIGLTAWGNAGQGQHYLAFPVLLAGVLIGRRASFGVAAISGAFIAWVGSQNAWGVEAAIALGGVCASVIVAWVMAEHAETRTQELRLARRDQERRLSERIEELDGACQQALKQLRLLDEKKSDFLVVLAHELRTPLTAIHGYAHLLSERDLPPELALLQQGLSVSADRLIRLVNDLLDMARLDLAAVELTPTLVRVGEIVPTAWQAFSAEAQQRSIAVRLNGLERLPRLHADPDLLYKLFCHLLSNAVKYTPDGGKIVVTGRVKSCQDVCGVEIAIADSGIGISPEALPLVFEKFYREDSCRLYSSSRTRFKGGGPGLGLAIARGIVKAHQGEIWVVSSGRDEIACPGSVLHVWLPVETD